jgi:hypothetical protein
MRRVDKDNMAFIKTIPPGKATGETAEVYQYVTRMVGYNGIPKIVQAFSLRAGSMKRMIRTWELAMWIGDEPRTMREMVASAVSRLNQCHY